MYLTVCLIGCVEEKPGRLLLLYAESNRMKCLCFLKNVSKVLMWISNATLTGITRFDLLGDFGRFNWLGNFYIVLSYNLLFAIVTTLCLVRKFTSAVREELLKAIGNTAVNLVCTSFPSSSVDTLMCCCWSSVRAHRGLVFLVEVCLKVGMHSFEICWRVRS